MADSYTSNLTMIKPEVGGSENTWGSKANGNFDLIDSIFKADGTGAPVGMNVGEGKVLAVEGSVDITGEMTVSDVVAQAVAKRLMPYMPGYQIGDLFVTTAEGNPAVRLGFGTWEAYGAGRVLVGHKSGDSLFGEIGAMGGSTDAVIVSHGHQFSASGSTGSDGGHSHSYLQFTNNGGSNGSPDAWGPRSYTYWTTEPSGAHTHTVSISGATELTGVSGVNANLQPYVTVYIWRRVA